MFWNRLLKNKFSQKLTFSKQVSKSPGSWTVDVKGFVDTAYCLAKLSNDDGAYLEKALNKCKKLPAKADYDLYMDKLSKVEEQLVKFGSSSKINNLNLISAYLVEKIENMATLKNWLDSWNALKNSITSLEIIAGLITLLGNLNSIDVHEESPGFAFFGQAYRQLVSELEYSIRIKIIRFEKQNSQISEESWQQNYKNRSDKLANQIKQWKTFYNKCSDLLANNEARIFIENNLDFPLQKIKAFYADSGKCLTPLDRLKRYYIELSSCLEAPEKPVIQPFEVNFPAIYKLYPELLNIETLSSLPIDRSHQLLEKSDKMLAFIIQKFWGGQTSFDLVHYDLQFLNWINDHNLSVNDLNLNLMELPADYRETKGLISIQQISSEKLRMLCDTLPRRKIFPLLVLHTVTEYINGNIDKFPKIPEFQWLKSACLQKLKRLSFEEVTRYNWDADLFDFIITNNPESNFGRNFTSNFVFRYWLEIPVNEKLKVFESLDKSNRLKFYDKIVSTAFQNDNKTLVSSFYNVLNPSLKAQFYWTIFLRENDSIDKLSEILLAESPTAIYRVILDTVPYGDLKHINKKQPDFVSGSFCQLILDSSFVSYLRNDYLEQILRFSLSNPQAISNAIQKEMLDKLLQRESQSDLIALYFDKRFLGVKNYTFSKTQWKVICKNIKSLEQLNETLLHETILNTDVTFIPSIEHLKILKSWRKMGESCLQQINQQQQTYLSNLTKQSNKTKAVRLAELLRYMYLLLTSKIDALDVPDEVLGI